MTDPTKKAVLDATFQRVELAVFSHLSDSDPLLLARIQQVLMEVREHIEADPTWLDDIIRATARPTES